jgi:hypothetical protein
MIRSLILAAAWSTAAFAQTGSLGAPFLGYVADGTHLRPLYGLPAAGAIGAAISSRDFSHIAIPPEQYFAVVSAADTGEVMVAQEVITGGFGLTAIPGASANPDILAMSPGGASAALWFAATGHLQAVTGLPNSPSVRDIDASFLNASPLAIAVSDDGQWAIGLFSAGVYAFGPGAQVIPLQTDPGIVALAFFHNSHNLALATSARATSIAGIGAANQLSVLYDYSAQSLSPRAIGISFDNQRAVVADTSGKLVNINIATSTANIADCGCSPTGLYGLNDAIFRLNGTGRTGTDRTGHTPDLKLFDAAAGAVWIVPPALSEATGARQ